MPLPIKLSSAEILMASQQATLRIIQCLQDGAKHRYKAQDKDTWQIGIEGAMGEMVIAKHFGIYWGKGSSVEQKLREYEDCKGSAVEPHYPRGRYQEKDEDSVDGR